MSPAPRCSAAQVLARPRNPSPDQGLVAGTEPTLSHDGAHSGAHTDIGLCRQRFHRFHSEQKPHHLGTSTTPTVMVCTRAHTANSASAGTPSTPRWYNIFLFAMFKFPVHPWICGDCLSGRPVVVIWG
jgi:hypothetical protein